MRFSAFIEILTCGLYQARKHKDFSKRIDCYIAPKTRSSLGAVDVSSSLLTHRALSAVSRDFSSSPRFRGQAAERRGLGAKRQHALEALHSYKKSQDTSEPVANKIHKPKQKTKRRSPEENEKKQRKQAQRDAKHCETARFKQAQKAEILVPQKAQVSQAQKQKKANTIQAQKPIAQSPQPVIPPTLSSDTESWTTVTKSKMKRRDRIPSWSNQFINNSRWQQSIKPIYIVNEDIKNDFCEFLKKSLLSTEQITKLEDVDILEIHYSPTGHLIEYIQQKYKPVGHWTINFTNGSVARFYIDENGVVVDSKPHTFAQLIKNLLNADKEANKDMIKQARIALTRMASTQQDTKKRESSIHTLLR